MAAPNRQLKILLVEDESIPMFVHKSMLEQMDYQPDTAENGEEAVALCTSNYYDVIFMDIGLPDINGIEVTARLRKIEAENNEQKQRAQVIGLTAYSVKEVQDKCKEAGMDKVFAKPVTPELLKATLIEIK